MDLGTLIGVGLAFVALIVSMIMEGGSPMMVIVIPPMILVFAGTFGAAMAGGLMRDSTGIVKWLKLALMSKPVMPNGLVETLVHLADRARREGLLALEDAAQDVEDPFLRQGLELAIDGTDPEELREILESQSDAKRSEYKSGAKLFNDMGGYAPTLGILGTVIGLVHVLANLSTPAKLGELIASAFVATLWGVLSANLMWLPMSNKIKRLAELEGQQMDLVIEGILAIQAGVNPRLIQQKLTSLLPASMRNGGKDGGKEDAGDDSQEEAA